jgi:cytochrome c-type biogenesis protein CcmF
VGVTLVSAYENEINVKMGLGERVNLSSYQLEFNGIKKVQGPNYNADQGQISVYKNNKLVAKLQPERRNYRVQTMGMTEAGIDPGLFRDIYVALGDPLDNGAWAVRAHYKPFVRWIWLGGIFMAFGGLLTMLDKRYRQRKKVSKSVDNESQKQNDFANAATHQ